MTEVQSPGIYPDKADFEVTQTGRNRYIKTRFCKQTI